MIVALMRNIVVVAAAVAIVGYVSSAKSAPQVISWSAMATSSS